MIRQEEENKVLRERPVRLETRVASAFAEQSTNPTQVPSGIYTAGGPARDNTREDAKSVVAK